MFNFTIIQQIYSAAMQFINEAKFIAYIQILKASRGMTYLSSLSKNATATELLNSVHRLQNYCENKSGTFP